MQGNGEYLRKRGRCSKEATSWPRAHDKGDVEEVLISRQIICFCWGTLLLVGGAKPKEWAISEVANATEGIDEKYAFWKIGR